MGPAEVVDLEKIDFVPVGQFEQVKKLIEGGTCPQPGCRGRLREVSVKDDFIEYECDVCAFKCPKASGGCDHCRATRISAQLFHEPTCPTLKKVKPNDLAEAVKQLPQTVWVVGKNVDDNKGWMNQGIFDSEQEAIDNCEQGEFIASCLVGRRLPDNVRDIGCIYWPNEQTKEEGIAKLEELQKIPVDEKLAEAFHSPFDKKKEEPITPKGYGELKIGMEGVLNGVPVRIRKITKKDIILRPLNRSIRDEAGLMVSFKDKKKIIENRESNGNA